MSGTFELKWPATSIPSGPFFTEAEYKKYSRPKSYLEFLQEKEAELRSVAPVVPQGPHSAQQAAASQSVCTPVAQDAKHINTEAPVQHPPPDGVRDGENIAAPSSVHDAKTTITPHKNEPSSDEHVMSPAKKSSEDTDLSLEENVESKPQKYHQWVTGSPEGTKKKGKKGDKSQAAGAGGSNIKYPRATLNTFFPRTSWFSHEEQKQYLELHRKYFAHLPPKPTPQEAKEIHTFREMHVKVVREQEEMLAHLETSANRWYTDYTFIHPDISHYVEEHLEQQKQRVKEYPRYYVQLDSVNLIPPKICSNPPHLRHVKTLLETGKVSRAALPNMAKKPRPKIPQCYGKISNKFPTAWPKKDKPVLSGDVNAEKLSQKYQASVVISSSGLKCLLDNHPAHLDRQWEIPVTIKDHTVIDDGEEKVHRVVYIDKPFPRKMMTVREKNTSYYSIALKALIQNPSHNASVVFGQHGMPADSPAMDAAPGVVHDDIFGDVMDVSELESFGNTRMKLQPSTLCKLAEQDPASKKGLHTSLKSPKVKIKQNSEEIHDGKKGDDGSEQKAVPSPEKPLLRTESEGFIVSMIDPDEDSRSGFEEKCDKTSQAKAEANKERLLQTGRIASALRRSLGSPLLVMMGGQGVKGEPSFPMPSGVSGESTAVGSSGEIPSSDKLDLDQSTLSDDSDNEELVIDTGDAGTSPPKTRQTRAAAKQQSESQSDSAKVKAQSDEDQLFVSCSDSMMETSDSQAWSSLLNDRPGDQVKESVNEERMDENEETEQKKRTGRRTRSQTNDNLSESTSPAAKRRSLQSGTEDKTCDSEQDGEKVEPMDSESTDTASERKTDTVITRHQSLRTQSRESSTDQLGVSVDEIEQKGTSSGEPSESSRPVSPQSDTSVRTRRSLRSCKQEPVDECSPEGDKKQKCDVPVAVDAGGSGNTEDASASSVHEGRVLRGGKRLKKQDASATSPPAKRQLRTLRASSPTSSEDVVKHEITEGEDRSHTEQTELMPEVSQEENLSGPNDHESSPQSPLADRQEISDAPASPPMQPNRPESPMSPGHAADFMEKPLRSIPLSPTSGYGRVVDNNVSSVTSPPCGSTYQSPPSSLKMHQMSSPTGKGRQLTTLDSILEAQDQLGQLGKSHPKVDLPSPVHVQAAIPASNGEDEWESAEDPTNHSLRPLEHNFSYNKWMLGDIPLLIRCSHHSNNRCKRREPYMLNLMPKLEYQPYLGLEQVTASETCQAWISTYIRHNTKLYRARINPFNAELFWADELDISQIVHPQSSFNPAAAMTILQGIIGRLTKLPSGAYLLSHMPSNSHVHIKKSVETSRGVYDLHLAYSQQVGVEPSGTDVRVPWIPLDTSFVMPMHYRLGRIPATFVPPTLAKGPNAPRRQQQQKIKPAKKKNKGRKNRQRQEQMQKKQGQDAKQKR